MAQGKKYPRGLKICCGITVILVIVFIIVSVVLFFTILKPKDPKLITQSVTLEHVEFVPIPFHLNVTLGIVVRIDNPNYGSFKYESSTAYVNYRGVLAAEAPIEADTISARSKHDVGTNVVVLVDNLISNPYFTPDFESGCLNFTSSTTLHGRAIVLNFLKIKATTSSTCDISLFVQTWNASSSCKSSIKY